MHPARWLFLLFACFALSPKAHAQFLLSWQQLEACEGRGGAFSFTPAIQQLDGEAVRIKGFLIPLDTDGEAYALSAYPLSSCFFCGNAGPGSVMELLLAEPRRFQTDEYLTFEGKLGLSPASEGLVFQLRGARLVK